MAVTINQITNANVYINGNNLLGKAERIKLPEVDIEQIEHKVLGLMGTVSLPGGINKLEAEIEWDGVYPEVYAQTVDPFNASQIMCRSNLMTYDAMGLKSEKPLVTIINGTFSKSTLGEFKAKEAVKTTQTIQVNAIKQMVEGKEVLAIDVMNNVFRVNGKDVLGQYRKYIGG